MKQSITRKDYINSLFALGFDREYVIDRVKKVFPRDDILAIENQVSVSLYELRQQGVVEPRKRGQKPSRHSIIKRCLLRDKTNRQTLKHLEKMYPEVSEKIHKQRICEYRWFYNHGLLH